MTSFPRRLSAFSVMLACGLATSPWSAAAFAQVEQPDAAAKPAPQPEPSPHPAPAKAQPPAAKEPASKPEDKLPIRKITLYRSGVGYFERSGQVTDNGEVQLRFNTDQINDILKSMILLDLNGGRVESVSYGSKEPLAKRLASFGINISDNPAASEILQRLRGTPVKITMPDGEHAGTIMNVETRPTVYPGGEKGATVVHNLPWINLLTKNGVQSFNLANMLGFEIMDASLAEELNKALGALAEYRADRSKTVDLRFAGQGSRRVVVGYVHEMPVWKTSYRLLLPELDAAGNTKGQLTIQGWAIVENTTDQDWNGVQLSLVSGRPVSFQMDLYEPLFSQRPWVAVPTIPGVTPRIFDLAIDADRGNSSDRTGRPMAETEQAAKRVMARERNVPLAAKAAAPSPAPGSPGGQSMYDASAAYAGITGGELADYAPKSAATAATVGEVFQFQVETPVSIERQRSAMIPIMAAALSGRRVSIFNASDGSQFPMRGVEITNDSNLALLPGPISVLDGAAYAGDAQIGQIPKNDKRMLAYALDLDMAVTTRPEQRTTMTRITIVDGSIRQAFKDRLTTSYAFANKDKDRGRTLILEHPKNPAFELVETEKPTEQTQDLYRFTLPIEAGKTRSFTVAQERVRHEDIGVTSYDMATLLNYRKDGKLSDKVVEAVRKAADKQGAIAATERQIGELNGRMKEISDDQARIRQNMSAIDRNSPLYSKYVSKLTDQETTLEELRDQQKKLQKQLDDQRTDLGDYLRTLNVE